MNKTNVGHEHIHNSQITTGFEEISSLISVFAFAISPLYSISFSLFDPACNGAITLYTGDRRGVTMFDADCRISLGGVHNAYLEYRYSVHIDIALIYTNHYLELQKRWFHIL